MTLTFPGIKLDDVSLQKRRLADALNEQLDLVMAIINEVGTEENRVLRGDRDSLRNQIAAIEKQIIIP